MKTSKPRVNKFMVNQYNCKKETVSGRLIMVFGNWVVQSSYGTFPIASHLKGKLQISNNGDWVSATVQCRHVTEYHFMPEPIDEK